MRRKGKGKGEKGNGSGKGLGLKRFPKGSYRNMDSHDCFKLAQELPGNPKKEKKEKRKTKNEKTQIPMSKKRQEVAVFAWTKRERRKHLGNSEWIYDYTTTKTQFLDNAASSKSPDLLPILYDPDLILPSAFSSFLALAMINKAACLLHAHVMHSSSCHIQATCVWLSSGIKLPRLFAVGDE